MIIMIMMPNTHISHNLVSKPPLMAAEEQLLQLFDFNWFQYEIFTSKPTSLPEKSKLFPTPIVRSFSDQFLSSKDELQSENSASPKSVLTSKLQTIPSGKEVEEFSKPVEFVATERKVIVKKIQRRRRKQGNSKSLSELEFEELKGFMDLGFVFSDEDKDDSSLVSIIPGLQRMGKEVESSIDDESGVSRPYLSEAWEVLNNNKKLEDPLRNWRIPAFGNETELKDHIKIWAHSVASTVKTC